MSKSGLGRTNNGHDEACDDDPDPSCRDCDVACDGEMHLAITASSGENAKQWGRSTEPMPSMILVTVCVCVRIF